ncbi:hypothetical protein [Thermosipho sp. (in: thermotogales)]|jgi:hypothetical protein|uniref:hypothetical protein n=1 Tax=Thermosipho sp. (in: thermotogales) TaxID=1968895 RepID=UPI00257AAA91|nr:hypothetical protein [Thermosipho sp. (in: thermotogales)]MBZ4649283.1 hypothetical protein [Thermosipho sp. (in: thermotogales)]
MITEDRWNRQLEFNQKFFKDYLNKSMTSLDINEKQEWTQKFLLHLVKELSEVLDEINFKMHRVENKEIILSNILEEITDIQKFTLGLYQLWGFTYEDYLKAFDMKTAVVEQRYKQEHELDLLSKNKLICGIDLDGVIFDYPRCFLDWAIKNFSLPLPYYKNLKQLKSSVGLETYEKIKDAYRQSGYKAQLPIKKNVDEFIKFLKLNGYQVIGLTSRPYEKYSRIYSDTLKCLKSHNIELDAIFWSKEKCLKIIKTCPNIKFFIDDDLNQVNSIAEQGYEVFWLYNPDEYDSINDLYIHNNVKVVYDFDEIISYIYKNI